jgi:UV excision repair protein RAD23
MKVTLKPLKGDNFEVEYEPDTLVIDLKKKISELKPEMPADAQKLIYTGKILDDAKKMEEYNIKEGEFLVVMVAKAKAPAAAPAAAPAPAPTTTPAAADSPPGAPNAQQMAASAMPTGNAGMEAAIEQLMGMGFERPLVEQCLRAAFGNPDRAVEYLMSGIPDSIQQEMTGGGGAPPAEGDAGYAGGATPAPASGGGPAPFPAMPGGGGGAAFPAMPAGGGGGAVDADLPPALAALRNSPQFAQLAQIVAQNPAALQQMLPALAASNPEAAQAVGENPEAFMRMLQQAAAGGGPRPGGGAGGGMPGMGGLPPGMLEMLASNPEMVEQLAAEIEQQDPAAAQQLRANPQGFIQAMNQMNQMAAAGGMPGMPPGAGRPGGPQVVQLSQEDGEAVARLVEISGRDRNAAAQAYLACDKNEEAAINFLFDNLDD